MPSPADRKFVLWQNEVIRQPTLCLFLATHTDSRCTNQVTLSTYSRQANCHPGTDTSVLYELGSCESSPGTDSWVHGPHQVSWLSKLGYW